MFSLFFAEMAVDGSLREAVFNHEAFNLRALFSFLAELNDLFVGHWGSRKD